MAGEVLRGDHGHLKIPDSLKFLVNAESSMWILGTGLVRFCVSVFQYSNRETVLGLTVDTNPKIRTIRFCARCYFDEAIGCVSRALVKSVEPETQPNES